MKMSHAVPRRSPRPEPIKGTSGHIANLAAPPSARRAPRSAGEPSATSVHTTNIAVSVSLEFDSSTKVVYGYAAHA
jgi:hypothetical protein